jgi:hypothetical protein
MKNSINKYKDCDSAYWWSPSWNFDIVVGFVSLLLHCCFLTSMSIRTGEQKHYYYFFFYLYWVPKFCISFFCTKYWTGKRGSRSINSQCFCLYTVFKIGWDLLICGIGRGDCLPSNNLKFCTEYGIYPTISFIASFICMHIILLCWFSLVLIVRC